MLLSRCLQQISRSATATATATRRSYHTSTTPLLSLSNVLRDTRHCWDLVAPGIVRATPFFRKLIRDIYDKLKEDTRRGIIYGNLNAASIFYDLQSPNNPIFCYPRGGVSTSIDFKALRDIMEVVCDPLRGHLVVDSETRDFMRFLTSPNAGKKHYWLMDVLERERFFCDVGLRCKVDFVKLFPKETPPPQVSQGKDLYCREFFRARWQEIGWKAMDVWQNMELCDTFWEIRCLFQHFHERYLSYNLKNKRAARTRLTVYDIERDFFLYYPQLWPAIYEVLQAKKITYLLY